MIKNYLASFWRFVSQNSFYSVLNMTGLIAGMTTFFLLIQYGSFEYSYDAFFDNNNQIFRVQQDRYNKGELTTRWASGCAGIGPALLANFPEIEHAVRLRRTSEIFRYGEKTFREENIFFAEKDFFKMFSLELSGGNASSVLAEPYTMVMSESMARKYFGNEDPVGKVLSINRDLDLKITGIFTDLPGNTHMTFDGLISFATYESFFDDPSVLNSWNRDAYMTYIQLHENADAGLLESKFPAFVEKEQGEDLRAGNSWVSFHLQPLRDIHLDSNFMFEFKPNGNRNTVKFLLIIAVLVILIAWINYINLSTARSIDRAREVGIRKTMGGVRTELIWQFMMESLILNLAAILMSLILTGLLTPVFSRISGRNLDYYLFFQMEFWLGLVILAVGGTLLSGLYPALVLSSHKPAGILKGKLKNTAQGLFLRKGLVTIQFIVSIILITGTYIIYRQVNFLRDQSVGVDIDQTLVIKSPGTTDSTYRDKYQVFKNRIRQFPEVVAVSASTEVPGTQPQWNAGGIRRLSQTIDEANQYRVIMMDEDFIPSYGLNLMSGRIFSGEVSNERKNVMLNEAACELMGFTGPGESIDDQIFFWGDTFTIVGVIKNYGQESLKKSYDPTVYRFSNSPGGYYSVKFNTANVNSSIVKFENEWKDVFPGNPFEYFFLDERYNAQYRADIQFGKIFGIFSSLAILIASLGLIGLSSLTVIQRTKEIGIRKVMGARAHHIISLMSREYILMLLAAIVMAIPVAFWIMSRWLESFASRIELTWWIFAVPCFMVGLLTLLAISFHTARAAGTNPVETLRYE
jgi:putative ABC transport system permease protein